MDLQQAKELLTILADGDFPGGQAQVFQGSTYRLESRLGRLIWTNSKLVQIDADGTKTIRYDSGTEHVANIA